MCLTRKIWKEKCQLTTLTIRSIQKLSKFIDNYFQKPQESFENKGSIKSPPPCGDPFFIRDFEKALETDHDVWAAGVSVYAMENSLIREMFTHVSEESSRVRV